MITRRNLVWGGSLAATFAAGLGARPALASPSVLPAALADFFAPAETRGAALSPAGTRIALLKQTLNRSRIASRIDVIDASQPQQVLTRIGLGGLELESVAWAGEGRLLVRAAAHFDAHGQVLPGATTRDKAAAMSVKRIISVAADGSGSKVLFEGDQGVLRRNSDLSAVIGFLRDDPGHVLMSAWDSGQVLSAYKVDVTTGQAELVEKGGWRTTAFWADHGTPVLRWDSMRGGVISTIFARPPGALEWKPVWTARNDQAPDFYIVGGTDRPGVITVAARLPGEDTVSVRELDLHGMAFGKPFAVRAGRDAVEGLVDDQGLYLGSRYIEDRTDYDFADKSFEPHFRALEGFFQGECNVRLLGADRSRTRYLAFVRGPREPGAFYAYDRTARRADNLGQANAALSRDRLAPMRALKVPTRDGAQITAYLTAPIGEKPGPLIVMPHGGPETRDTWDFDRRVQILAAQGWWVLQPNFRGSGGCGLAFARAGWRSWGERMQADVEDAVEFAVKTNRLDASRVGIVGASYGGYAALMGTVRRPDLYKASIAICGLSDLIEMLDYERANDDTPDREDYRFWVQRIGDPAADKALLEKASPRLRAHEIEAPVLLVHGSADPIVPVQQSRGMAQALKAAGKRHELLEIAQAGHVDWSAAKEEELMARYVAFLSESLSV